MECHPHPQIEHISWSIGNTERRHQITENTRFQAMTSFTFRYGWTLILIHQKILTLQRKNVYSISIRRLTRAIQFSRRK